jgi:hypothetical protein
MRTKKMFTIAVLVVLLTGMACLLARAEQDFRPRKVYLVVMSCTNTGNSAFHFNYHEVESLEACYDMVNHARVDIPDDGDAESSVVIYCTTSPVRVWEYKDIK